MCITLAMLDSPPHQKKIKASSLTEDMKYLVRVPECALFWPGRASHLFNLTLTPPPPPFWQPALLQKLFKLYQHQRENTFEIKHPSNINFAIRYISDIFYMTYIRYQI